MNETSVKKRTKQPQNLWTTKQFVVVITTAFLIMVIPMARLSSRRERSTIGTLLKGGLPTQSCEVVVDVVVIVAAAVLALYSESFVFIFLSVNHTQACLCRVLTKG